MTVVAEAVVVDASAMVDVLAGTALAPAVSAALRGRVLHAPAHFDAEILSALGRMHRGGQLTERHVTLRLRRLATAPVQRHPLAPLFAGAWRRHHNLRLVDAFYAELAEDLQAPLITTDSGLAAAETAAELIGGG